jgi:hypothetical protein
LIRVFSICPFVDYREHSNPSFAGLLTRFPPFNHSALLGLEMISGLWFLPHDIAGPMMALLIQPAENKANLLTDHGFQMLSDRSESATR